MSHCKILQVRVEKVNQPEDYIHALLDRVKKEYIQKTYGITEWESPEDFLEQVAKKSGRLLKVGSTIQSIGIFKSKICYRPITF